MNIYLIAKEKKCSAFKKIFTHAQWTHISEWIHFNLETLERVWTFLILLPNRSVFHNFFVTFNHCWIWTINCKTPVFNSALIHIIFQFFDGDDVYHKKLSRNINMKGEITIVHLTHLSTSSNEKWVHAQIINKLVIQSLSFQWTMIRKKHYNFLIDC